MEEQPEKNGSRRRRHNPGAGKSDYLSTNAVSSAGKLNIPESKKRSSNIDKKIFKNSADSRISQD